MPAFVRKGEQHDQRKQKPKDGRKHDRRAIAFGARKLDAAPDVERNANNNEKADQQSWAGLGKQQTKTWRQQREAQSQSDQ